MDTSTQMLARAEWIEIDHGVGIPPNDVVRDGARLAALHDLGILDTAAEQEFDRYTSLATELIGAPISVMSLVDADRQFFKSQAGCIGAGAGVRQTPLSHSFCQHAVSTGQPLVVTDAREHPLVADNLAVRDLGVIAYLGMPLVLSDGHALGALCVIDGKPRDWSERDLRILDVLASAIVAHLEVRRLLAERSLSDRVTGLANRALVYAHARQLLASPDPTIAGSVAAICIGLDGFALVNDAYGAAAGDRLLAQVGERLGAETSPEHLLGRLGGDVFALVGHDMADDHTTFALADRLRAVLSDRPFDIDGQDVGVTATVGIAGGARGSSGADLLLAADGAMRRAKASARPVLTAVAGIAEVASAKLGLRCALLGALDRGELRVAYQPIVDLASGAPIGFEALARWNHPRLGAVAPSIFLPEAARSGDIVKIGEWVLRTACAQLAEWRRHEACELSISVNLDPLQLALPSLRSVVRSALDACDLPAGALVLELTESALIGVGPLQTRNLQEVRELGVRISLDDFGTGYCPLGYIKRFPIDEVKIDIGFVRNLETDPRDVALVRAILALADGLGLDVVAEGIETTEQLAKLKLLGCGRGQGYLFAPPRLPAQVEVLRLDHDRSGSWRA